MTEASNGGLGGPPLLYARRSVWAILTPRRRDRTVTSRRHPSSRRCRAAWRKAGRYPPKKPVAARMGARRARRAIALSAGAGRHVGAGPSLVTEALRGVADDLGADAQGEGAGAPALQLASTYVADAPGTVVSRGRGRRERRSVHGCHDRRRPRDGGAGADPFQYGSSGKLLAVALLFHPRPLPCSSQFSGKAFTLENPSVRPARGARYVVYFLRAGSISS